MNRSLQRIKSRESPAFVLSDKNRSFGFPGLALKVQGGKLCAS